MRRRARLRELMAAENIKDLSAFARRVGIDVATVSRWDRELVQPSEALRERVGAAFEGRYAEEWLFPRIPEQPQEKAS